MGEGPYARVSPRFAKRETGTATARHAFLMLLARSERFELPTLGFEVRCSIQLSYERVSLFNALAVRLIFLRRQLGTENDCRKYSWPRSDTRLLRGVLGDLAVVLQPRFQ